VHFAVVVVALSLSSRTVWGGHITLSKERGWSERERKKRDQVIVNTLCLIILVVLLFLLSLSLSFFSTNLPPHSLFCFSSSSFSIF
jgi:hypothetical protein